VVGEHLRVEELTSALSSLSLKLQNILGSSPPSASIANYIITFGSIANNIITFGFEMSEIYLPPWSKSKGGQKNTMACLQTHLLSCATNVHSTGFWKWTQNPHHQTERTKQDPWCSHFVSIFTAAHPWLSPPPRLGDKCGQSFLSVFFKKKYYSSNKGWLTPPPDYFFFIVLQTHHQSWGGQHPRHASVMWNSLAPL